MAQVPLPGENFAMSYVEINTAANPAFLDTTQFTGGGGSQTLAQTYANGAAAADQTMLISAAKGGPIIAKANAAATGALLMVEDSVGNTIVNIPDNATMTFVSYAVNGATAVGYSFDTFVSLSTSGAHIADFSDLGTPQVSIAKGGLILGLNAPNGYVSLNASTSQLVFGVNTSHKSTVSLTEDTATIIGGVANGASAVAVVIDTVNTLSTAGSKIISFRTNTVEVAFINRLGDLFLSGTTGVAVPNGSGIFNTAGSLGLTIAVSGVLSAGAFGGPIGPQVDNNTSSGASTNRWSASYAYWYDNKLGAQLTAAATVTPTSGLHHVTGATTIDTIATTNLPTSGNVFFTIIADGGTITWSAAGNILTAGTVAQNKAATFVFDATAAKWSAVV
jgi:hypothetical protein